jgi:hypothetical protein
LRQAIAGWHDRIGYVAGSATNALGLSALLVRPDGFVAWASHNTAVAGDVESAATRWFGAR